MTNIVFKKIKVACKVVLSIPLCLLLVTGSAYSSGTETGDDVSALMQEFKELKQKFGEMDDLKKRVGELEKKVSSQEEIIKRQKRALEKAGEIAPAIKEAMMPPEKKVLVKSFILEGVNLFDAKDFEPILGRYRNKELGLRDLKKAADEITNFYRGKGYITSLAYAPNQEISDNTVEFRIIEGQVGEIKIEGGKHYKEKPIAWKFKVEEGQILDYNRLEKNVKRLNKQPDRTVKTVLLPGKEQGTSDIVVKMQEESSPQHVYLEYKNSGTKVTGKNRFAMGYVNNNLLGHEDMFSIKGQVGQNYDKVNAVVMDYNFPINTYDTRVGAYGLYSHADIGGQFQIISPEGEAAAFGPYITHPLFDKNLSDPVAMNVSGNITAGFDWVSVRNKILGNETSHDELRVPKIGLGIDEKDSRGRTFLSNEVRFGMDNFMGSLDEYDESASRLNAGGEFVKYTASLSRITKLPFSSMLISSFKLQLTDNPLVNSEQLSLGGVNSIRGFPENDYLADYGWFSNIEFRTPAFFFPSALKVPYDKKATSLKDAVQLVYFVDFGKGNLKFDRAGEQRNDIMIGAGIGLRFDLYKHLKGRIDWGFPVGNEEPSDNSSNTVYMSIQCDLW
ncbi:MAG: ShlB/FhaC/HecB family hemolysin secretion/activation protein [Candidatus Gorgyraea atricola]|nr:ShlB/FhaC/HecB family hemolysin secretion/activation protein [Candidatus Gorgyraea atricola]